MYWDQKHQESLPLRSLAWKKKTTIKESKDMEIVYAYRTETDLSELFYCILTWTSGRLFGERERRVSNLTCGINWMILSTHTRLPMITSLWSQQFEVSTALLFVEVTYYFNRKRCSKEDVMLEWTETRLFLGDFSHLWLPETRFYLENSDSPLSWLLPSFSLSSLPAHCSVINPKQFIQHK